MPHTIKLIVYFILFLTHNKTLSVSVLFCSIALTRSEAYGGIRRFEFRVNIFGILLRTLVYTHKKLQKPLVERKLERDGI